MTLEVSNKLIDYIFSSPERLDEAAAWLANQYPVLDQSNAPEITIGRLAAGFSGAQSSIPQQGQQENQGMNLGGIGQMIGAGQQLWGGGGGGTNYLGSPSGGWGGMLGGGGSGLSSGTMPSGFWG